MKAIVLNNIPRGDVPHGGVSHGDVARGDARCGASAWRRSVQLVGVLALAVAFAGCSKSKEASKDKSAKTEQAESSDETAAAVKPPEPSIPDEAIPTEEDFELDVEKQIKPESNLPAELDKLEKEIGD
jgi:hypothetical protein